MKASLCTAVLFGVLLSAACAPAQPGQRIVGSGTVATEQRLVSNFNLVVLTGIGDLVLKQGDDEGLTLQAESNLLPMIKTEVKEGVLRIALEPPHPGDELKPTKDVRYALTVKALTGLTNNGAGSIMAEGLRLENVTVTINGAGTVSMSGSASRQSVFMSGGQYKAGDLDSREARINVTGSGIATLWVREALDVKCMGGCVVNHYGDPAVTKDIKGGGAVAMLSGK